VIIDPKSAKFLKELKAEPKEELTHDL